MSITKICSCCKINLPVSSFNKHSQTKDGLRSKCINCRRLEHIEYRKKNPEKIKQLQLVCDKRKAEKRFVSNKNKIRCPRKRRITENLRNLTVEGNFKNKSRQLRWRLRNREKYEKIRNFRNFLKRSSTLKCLTKEDQDKISEFFLISKMFKLYTGQQYHVDHIVPLVNKDVCGLNVPWNLRVILAFDNLSKGNKFDELSAIDFSAEAYH